MAGMPKHSAVAGLPTDDASQLIARCGKPLRDRRKADGSFRDLTYQGIAVHFYQGSDGGWDFTSATPSGQNATVDASAIAQVLPCFRQAVSVTPAAITPPVASGSQIPFRVLGLLTLLAIVLGLYLLGRVRTMRRVSLDLVANGPKQREYSDDQFVHDMRELARQGPGVGVSLETGRRATTDDFEIRPRAQPIALAWGVAIISADVRIETLWFTFSAVFSPRANKYDPRLYYEIQGLARDVPEEQSFSITADTFRWTGERPANPLLVKHVLRRWSATPEVLKAIASEKRKLPTPKKSTSPDDHD